eukprot:7295578-Prymnesium_polylepis.1
MEPCRLKSPPPPASRAPHSRQRLARRAAAHRAQRRARKPRVDAAAVEHVLARQQPHDVALPQRLEAHAALLGEHPRAAACRGACLAAAAARVRLARGFRRWRGA